MGHVERMEAELLELTERYDRAEAYLAHTPDGLLDIQLSIMSAYMNVLTQRLVGARMGSTGEEF